MMRHWKFFERKLCWPFFLSLAAIYSFYHACKEKTTVSCVLLQKLVQPARAVNQLIDYQLIAILIDYFNYQLFEAYFNFNFN
jgi:hypothetical protein